MRYSNELVLDTVSVTGTNAYTSNWIDATSMFQISVQAVTAGSNPNGTMKLQFSNDVGANGQASITNASDVTSATVSTTNNGVYAIQKTDICAQWVRVVYTNASGSGTISARLRSNGA